MHKLSAAATIEQFKKVFLEKYFKPSDSIEARAELQKLSQSKRTVEAYAAEFIQTRSRISLGTVVDSSTQARWFLEGLKNSVKIVLTNSVTVTVLNDIEVLIPAAVDAETRLPLTLSQDRSHEPVRTAAVKNSGRSGGRKSGRHGGRGRFQPYPQNPARGHSRSRQQPRVFGRGQNNTGNVQSTYHPGLNGQTNQTWICNTCKLPGHLSGANCPKTDVVRYNLLRFHCLLNLNHSLLSMTQCVQAFHSLKSCSEIMCSQLPKLCISIVICCSHVSSRCCVTHAANLCCHQSVFGLALLSLQCLLLPMSVQLVRQTLTPLSMA